MSTASRERLRALLHNAGTDPDLVEANLLIALEAYPRLDVDRWLGVMDRLATDADAAAPGLDGVIVALRAMELRGDRSTYDDPRNSFVHEVLDRRLGLPIALSAITVAVAARIGVPVVPIALPGHVLVADVSGYAPRYVDPFDDWADRTVDDCAEIVRMVAGTPLAPEHLAPASPRQIVRRMLVNLTGSYIRRELYRDALWAVELQAIVDPDDPGIAEQLRALERFG